MGKFTEMALALRIEVSLSKARILEEYLNRVDFGPNLRGIGAATESYFGKPVAALSLGQSALLVGLLKGRPLTRSIVIRASTCAAQPSAGTSEQGSGGIRRCNPARTVGARPRG